MYSQNNEEAIILKFFGEGFKGTFLEIGAFDGIHESNTRRLFELGWRGVLVEPSPEQFSKLVLLYGNEPRATLVNAAVSHTPGLEYFHYSHYWASTLSEPLVKLCPEHFTEKLGFWVNTIGLQPLRKWLPYDFISIDAEDRDWEICHGMDPSFLAGCRMICVEHQRHADSEWRELFAPFGLNLHAVTHENRIFART